MAVSIEGNVFSDSTQIDHEDGTFTIAYRAPGVCGPAVLFIGCGTLRVGIPGSPFQINFFDCDPPPVTNATISRNGVQMEILFEYGTDLGGFPGFVLLFFSLLLLLFLPKLNPFLEVDLIAGICWSTKQGCLVPLERSIAIGDAQIC